MSELLANRGQGRRALQRAPSSGLDFYGERLEDVLEFGIDHSHDNYSGAVQRQRTAQGLSQSLVEQHLDRLAIILGQEEVRFVVPDDAQPTLQCEGLGGGGW